VLLPHYLRVFFLLVRVDSAARPVEVLLSLTAKGDGGFATEYGYSGSLNCVTHFVLSLDA
jgi:hypothetical protein